MVEVHSCISPLIRLISTGIHKLLNTDVEDQEEERIRHLAVTIKIVSVTCFLLNLTGIQEFFQEFWAAYLKNLHIESHSVSPSGLNEHRPRNGSIKSRGYPVSPRNILAVKSSDFLILSYSTYLSDQLAVGLENRENFPVSAHAFLQITTVSRRHGVSSLATSGQKILSRGNVYLFANQQSRWSRNMLHQPKV